MKSLARMLMMLAIASTVGCAQKDWIDRTLVTENVTGSWYGTMGSPAGSREDIWFTLKQEGSKVTGDFRTPGRLANWITTEGVPEGTVAGDVFRFSDTRRTFTGELTVNGDEMHGQLGRNQADLRRVESSSAAPPAKP